MLIYLLAFHRVKSCEMFFLTNDQYTNMYNYVYLYGKLKRMQHVQEFVLKHTLKLSKLIILKLLHDQYCIFYSVDDYLSLTFVPNRKSRVWMDTYMYVKFVTVFFSGVTLDGGKRYTQTVESSFHLSMAALEPSKGWSCRRLKKHTFHILESVQHDTCMYSIHMYNLHLIVEKT